MKIIDDAKHHTRSFLRVSTQIYKELTSPIRLLPDFLIIGAQRCGTTSLYYYLAEHPYIFPGSTKEMHFFDDAYTQGLCWYRRQFPTSIQKYYTEHIRRHGFLTGEATPSYLLHPHAPKRISAILPKVKLIVLLRNPVDRAYSQHWLMVKVNNEMLSFKDALLREQGKIVEEQEKILADVNYSSQDYRRYSYLTRGIYVDQLQRWLNHFQKEQFLILRSEDLYSNPAEVVRLTLEFLGVPERDIKTNKDYKQYRLARKTGYLSKDKPPAMDPEIREYLIDYFKPHNARLSALLGRDFGWDR